MIEVIDEVLAGIPKFRIRDNSGNIIVDNVTIEMITEIVQSGTKLNKVLFDSIRSTLDFNAENTQNVMKYITCESTIKELTFNEDLLGNCLELQSDNITEYRENMTVKLIIPTLDSTYRTFININRYGYKEVIGIKTSGYYTLIYDGINFVISTEIDSPRINKNLSVKTGTISHGSTIPKTAGYNYYIYFVSLSSGTNQFGQSNGYEITGTGNGIKCSVDQTTRVVTAQVIAYYRYNTKWQTSTVNGSANYIEIAWN